MKIDRRSFLSFVAGGAIGTAMSPVPWKLMDDVSIWSQVWPWVPVPKSDKSTYSDTACLLCSGGCGLSIRKVGNRAVKIEGLKDHPVNDGGICGLGLSGLQLLYGPTRVKTPMKRVGKRGSGKWQQISWNEAISVVVEKLQFINDSDSIDKIACISGYGSGTVQELIKRFLKACGSSNFMKIPSSEDINRLALKAICGSDVIVDYDFENSDFILSLGSGLADGWMSPVRMLRTSSKWNDNDVTIVQVESVFSDTAAKANHWVSINPGTEADFAFGIAAFLINHGLYDIDFIANKISNFTTWKNKLLSKYSPTFVSKITGVSVETITKISKLFAKATKPIVLGGRGKGDVPSGFRDYFAANLLNFIKGNINKPGGIWFCKDCSEVNWPPICSDSLVNLNDNNIDNSGNLGVLNDNNALVKLISDLNSGKTPVEVLFLADVNPCYVLSDTISVKKAFECIPFMVSFSSFMDETTFMADLILPNHIYLERLEDFSFLTGSGKPSIGLLKPVVSPQFNTRHIGETIINIAHKFGGTLSDSFPWLSYQSCLEKSMGEKWFFLQDKGFWNKEELDVVEIASLNFTGEEFSEIQIEGDSCLFPYILISRDTLRLSSDYIATPPFLVKTIEDTVVKKNDGFVEINPQTASKLGLLKDSYAILSTPKSEVKVRVHISDRIRPEVLVMVRGLGHTAYSKHIAGKGININSLIGPVKDPIFGHDAVWGIRAQLVKA